MFCRLDSSKSKLWDRGKHSGSSSSGALRINNCAREEKRKKGNKERREETNSGHREKFNCETVPAKASAMPRWALKLGSPLESSHIVMSRQGFLLPPWPVVDACGPWERVVNLGDAVLCSWWCIWRGLAAECSQPPIPTSWGINPLVLKWNLRCVITSTTKVFLELIITPVVKLVWQMLG